MAPDKIYLQELSDGTWDDCFVYESSETDTEGMKRVPYIRKEALIEWLNSEIKKEMEDHYDDFSFGIAYGNVLEHINEM